MTYVQARVTVAVDAETAFKIFTDEIDGWYVRGPHSWHNPDRAVAIGFEDHRLVEIWDNGYRVTLGRVHAWEPARRLAWSDLHTGGPPDPPTEVEVRFEVAGEGTDVVLTHSGLERVPPEDRARIRRGYAWQILLRWFAESLSGSDGPG